MNISLVMIVKNEEKNLAKCLNSVENLVDEIVIVDSGSTDKTIEIAKTFGAKIFKREFDSFSNQKNYALSIATNEWVLHLDADEVLSKELVEEIKFVIINTKLDGFYLIRTNFFLGKQMKHSGINKEYRLRLAKKSVSKYVGGIIHEELIVNGKVGKLKNIMIHNSYPTISSYFNKLEQYTTLGAKKLLEKNKKAKVIDIVFKPPFEFIKRYILKCGFLDGIRGFIWAVLYAFYTFIKYIKLWEFCSKKH